MSFFNNETSEYIQHISLGLEFFGLGLAIVDVVFTKIAKKIEQLIFKAEQRFIRIFKVGLDRNYKKFFTYYVIGLSVCVLIFSYMIPNNFEYRWTLYLTLIIYSIVPIFGLLGRCLRFLNKISNNRALSAFGLILALLGFIGEVYQVITIHLD